MAEKIRRTSKYVGKTYQGWTVADIFVRKVQGVKCTHKRVDGKLARSANPRSTQYTYMLERITSDGKCQKRIALNAAQMLKVARGLVDVEALADNFFGKAETDYRFN